MATTDERGQRADDAVLEIRDVRSDGGTRSRAWTNDPAGRIASGSRTPSRTPCR